MVESEHPAATMRQAEATPLSASALGDQNVPKRRVAAWAIYYWGIEPFFSVINTFVFAVYLTTSSGFLDPAIAALSKDDPARVSAVGDLSSNLGFLTALAGVLVAILAPAFGRTADGTGRKKVWLAFNTWSLVICMALMFFIEAKPSFFWAGAVLIATGNIFAEIAVVNYNSLLPEVSTQKTVGRISGLGWGVGYMGGIVALLISYVAFVAGDGPYLFGVTSDGGMNFRVIALMCAIWTLIFTLPVLFLVPEPKAAGGEKPKKVGFFRNYVELYHDIVRLFHELPNTFWFLIASAIFRDGLAGAFTFGGILAAGTFGFSSAEVLFFGIVANVVAGIATISSGVIDDKFGPRKVILVSLAILTGCGVSLFILHDAGQTAFWVIGLILAALVGPAQSASRSFLARLTPKGREAEMFGLYATTGRAVSFLSQFLWATFIVWFGAQYWGVLGIAIVLFLGFLAMLPIKLPKKEQEQIA